MMVLGFCESHLIREGEICCKACALEAGVVVVLGGGLYCRGVNCVEWWWGGRCVTFGTRIKLK
jgi:hypothetical protein